MKGPDYGPPIVQSSARYSEDRTIDSEVLMTWLPGYAIVVSSSEGFERRRPRAGALRLAMCLALGVVATAQQPSAWTDPSPHKQQLVRIDSETSIELLDWGGRGPVLVLLAQLSQTAHIYDDWAPKLARNYRVLGVTRRGFGQSTTTAPARSMERLAMDIVGAMDAANVRQAILVGNQFAGEEMSWIASSLPNRVAGLIYLDAAYDRSNVLREEAPITRRIPPQPPRPDDMASAPALTRWVSSNIGAPFPESEVRQMAQFGDDGRVVGERTPAAVSQQILAAIGPTDYSKIRVPVLAIYAKPTSANRLPGCREPRDAAVSDACAQLYTWMLRHLADSERSLKLIGGRAEVVELVGANPFVFLSNEKEVTMTIDRFVAALPK